METVIITRDSEDLSEDLNLPADMADEVKLAFGERGEREIHYARIVEPNREPMHLIFFPRAGRGGVCCGGYTEWTYCDSLDDLVECWENYDDLWSN